MPKKIEKKKKLLLFVAPHFVVLFLLFHDEIVLVHTGCCCCTPPCSAATVTRRHLSRQYSHSPGLQQALAQLSIRPVSLWHASDIILLALAPFSRPGDLLLSKQNKSQRCFFFSFLLSVVGGSVLFSDFCFL